MGVPDGKVPQLSILGGLLPVGDLLLHLAAQLHSLPGLLLGHKQGLRELGKPVVDGPLHSRLVNASAICDA